MLELLKLAGEIAMPTDRNDPRNFWLAAIGIRKDNVQVVSRNGAVHSTSHEYKQVALAHAEARAVRKLGRGGIVYVSRISRKTLDLAMARPCPTCQIKLKAAKVEKVFYSISPSSYGIWIPETGKERISND